MMHIFLFATYAAICLFSCNTIASPPRIRRASVPPSSQSTGEAAKAIAELKFAVEVSHALQKCHENDERLVGLDQPQILKECGLLGRPVTSGETSYTTATVFATHETASTSFDLIGQTLGVPVGSPTMKSVPASGSIGFWSCGCPTSTAQNNAAIRARETTSAPNSQSTAKISAQAEYAAEVGLALHECSASHLLVGFDHPAMLKSCALMGKSAVAGRTEFQSKSVFTTHQSSTTSVDLIGQTLTVPAGTPTTTTAPASSLLDMWSCGCPTSAPENNAAIRARNPEPAQPVTSLTPMQKLNKRLWLLEVAEVMQSCRENDGKVINVGNQLGAINSCKMIGVPSSSVTIEKYYTTPSTRYTETLYKITSTTSTNYIGQTFTVQASPTSTYIEPLDMGEPVYYCNCPTSTAQNNRAIRARDNSEPTHPTSSLTPVQELKKDLWLLQVAEVLKSCRENDNKIEGHFDKRPVVNSCSMIGVDSVTSTEDAVDVYTRTYFRTSSVSTNYIGQTFTVNVDPTSTELYPATYAMPDYYCDCPTSSGSGAGPTSTT
ncbi:MAG: hypothetical protein Q9227_008679 [Pyrenula ochraceoflavens]